MFAHFPDSFGVASNKNKCYTSYVEFGMFAESGSPHSFVCKWAFYSHKSSYPSLAGDAEILFIN